MSRILQNIDKILAVSVLLIVPVAILLVIILLPSKSHHYIVHPIMLFIGAVAYLIIRKRLNLLRVSQISEPQTKSSTYLVLNILFFGIFFYSMLSVLLRSELYSRPLAYFVSTTLLTGLVAIEILFLPRVRGAISLNLMKSMLILLSLAYTIQVITPALVGFDSWMHQDITLRLLETGHTQPNTAYGGLPALHTIVGSTMLLTSLNFKTSAMLSMGILQASSLVFIFLLCRNIFKSDQVGLLAALLGAIASTYVVGAFWIRPIGLGAILLPSLLYLLFKARQDKSPIFTALAILMGATLILTHALSTTIMALLLLLFLVFSMIYNKGYNTRSEATVTLGYVILFMVMMISWWTYVSGHGVTLTALFNAGFIKPIRFAPGEFIPTGTLYPLERVLNLIGFGAFLGLSFSGICYMTSKICHQKYAFVIAASTLMFFGVIFLTLLLQLTAFYPGRWYSTVQILSAIPLAVGLFLICGAFKSERIRVLMLAFIIIFLSFFSITSPPLNMDYPIYSKNTMFRIFYTEAELEAGNTISNIYTRKGLLSDSLYSGMFTHPEYGVMRDIGATLFTRDFSGSTDLLLIIRQEIIGRAFAALRTEVGILKIDYDPREAITDLRYPLVYHSGTVFAFYRKQLREVFATPVAGKVGDSIQIAGRNFKSYGRVNIYFTSQVPKKYDRIDDEITDYQVVRDRAQTRGDGRLVIMSFIIPEDINGTEAVHPGTYYILVTEDDSPEIKTATAITVLGDDELVNDEPLVGFEDFR